MDNMNNIDENNPQELSVNNEENNQIDSPDKEIEISENLLTEDELSNQGYKKVHDSMAHVFAPLLQRVPESIAKSITRKSVENSFNQAVRGTFRCTLDPSMHLAHRKGQPDVFLGTGLDNVSNKISGQASWTKNNATLTVSVTPEIISGVFNAMSIVTSQYYLSEINNKLDNIDKRLDILERKLEDKDLSKLENDYKTLKDIQNKMSFIKKDPDRISANYNLILGIKKDSYEFLLYFEKQINNIINQPSQNKDREQEISDKLNKLLLYQNCFIFAYHIYLFANVMELSLKNFDDKNELKIIYDDLLKTYRDSNQIITRAYHWEIDFIKNSKKINEISIGKQIGAHAAGFAAGLAAGFSGEVLFDKPFFSSGSSLTNALNDISREKLYKKRTELFSICNEHNEKLRHISIENRQIIKNIENYREPITQKTELIYIDGKWYFKKIPDSISDGEQLSAE